MFIHALILNSLLGAFNFQQLPATANVSRTPVAPLGDAKVHYVLTQRWDEKDADGKPQDKEEKICMGDADAPVVLLGDEDGIPTSLWKTVECLATPRPMEGTSVAAGEKITVKFTFFIIYMNVDIFGNPGAMTKNFVGFITPDKIRFTSTGFASTPDLNAKVLAMPIQSQARYDEVYQKDTSLYTVAALYNDDVPAPAPAPAAPASASH